MSDTTALLAQAYVLHALRTDHGLSPLNIARFARVTEQEYRLWENGHHAAQLSELADLSSAIGLKRPHLAEAINDAAKSLSDYAAFIAGRIPWEFDVDPADEQGP